MDNDIPEIKEAYEALISMRHENSIDAIMEGVSADGIDQQEYKKHGCSKFAKAVSDAILAHERGDANADARLGKLIRLQVQYHVEDFAEYLYSNFKV